MGVRRERQTLPVVVSAGEFERIYDPSVGEDEQWYVNDHTFVRGADGTPTFDLTNRGSIIEFRWTGKAA